MSETSDCIVFSDAAIKRGDHIIWQHGTFAIPTGSVTAIVGTNGTGKTTMMRAELGLLPLCHGSLTVLGKPAGEMNKRIGYVPQSYVANVDSNLTAEQSVLLGLTGTRFGIHPITKAQKAKALEAMEFTGIADKARYRLSELSGGLRQRVAIARALCMQPEVLLFDEPTKGLDEARIRLVADTLNELDGQTMVCVTHDLSFARDVANRIGVMYAANLIEVADADELYAHPLHPYTRDMLAAMPENGLHFRPGYAPAHDDTRVTGCKYRMRCPNCSEKCAEMPPMADVDGHKVRCWQYV